MFFISLTYRTDLSKIDAHVSDHRAYLDRNIERGIFLLAGRKVPRTGGIILAVAPDRDALIKIVQEDPFVAHGLATYEITEFEVTRSSASIPDLGDQPPNRTA